MIYYPLIHSNIYYLKKPINFQSRLCLINKKVKINNEIYQPDQKQLKMRLSKNNQLSEECLSSVITSVRSSLPRKSQTTQR